MSEDSKWEKHEEEPPHWLDFKGIAASVGMALRRANHAQSTGDLLRLAAFSAHTVPADTRCGCDDLRNQLVEIEEEHLHALGKELRRSTLTTAIGILDFCLFEILLFMVSTNPNVLQRLPPAYRKGSDPLASARDALKRTSITRRIEFINEALLISVPASLKNELDPLLAKRHAITHQSKFYETIPSSNTTIIQAHPFPEVSFEESMMALIIVAEITDCVLVGVAKDYFDLDLGDLRPLTPAVADVNRSMRLKFQEKKERGPAIEEIGNPDWSVFVQKNWVFVADRNLTVTLSPFMDRFPVSVYCPKHEVHGEKPYITVDSGKREEAGFMDASFLARLLVGKTLLVEYHSYSSDVPLYRRLILEGFTERWAEAQAMKAAQSDKDQPE